MAQNWRDVNWFRFVVVVGLSFLTSMIFNLGDEHLSILESARTLIQALIAGFAFLQCPEINARNRGEQ